MLPPVALSLGSHTVGRPAAAAAVAAVAVAAAAAENGLEVALRGEQGAAGSEVCCASQLPGVFRKGSMCASQFTRVSVGMRGVHVSFFIHAAKSL